MLSNDSGANETEFTFIFATQGEIIKQVLKMIY